MVTGLEMEDSMGIIREAYGVTKNEDRVTKYTMTNQNGMRVSIIDFGAVITNIWMPDKNGVLEDIALGFGSIEGYEVNKPAFGAIVGRVANRISNASFTLNGKTYQLEQNDETNCLHGGTKRFEKRMYKAECSMEEGADSVSFTRLSKDMEQGFPGNLTVTVTYTLNDANELIIDYYAVSDADTVVSLTNHCYYNIGKGGHKCKTVLGQELQVFSDAYTPVNEVLVPTGEIRSVENTAMDFREPHRIGERIGEPLPDDSIVAGYDHNYILIKEDGEIVKAAVYSDRETGRVIEVFTDFPGVQVYTARELSVESGKEDIPYSGFAGICFETQNYPDAVNHPEFPSAVLRAGEEYKRTAVFHFAISDKL